LTCSITLQDASKAKVVAVEGDADLNSAGALHAAIEEASRESDVVIIDLSGATLIDSRTIGVLASWVQKRRDDGARMPIVCAEPNIRRLFATIGLEGEFEFFASREAALNG
jgi:anti-sigma B factor antagonist